MSKIKNITFVIIFTISCSTLMAQYLYLQINMEIKNQSQDIHTRFSIYQDTLSYVTIKNNPYIDPKIPETWAKRDFDTIIVIDEKDFIKVADMAAKLSTVKILEGMKIPSQSNEKNTIKVEFELNMYPDQLIYKIENPDYKSEERNLSLFMSTCKEIILLANKNPADYIINSD